MQCLDTGVDQSSSSITKTDSLENSSSSKVLSSHSPIFSIYFFTYSSNSLNFLMWRVSRSKMQSRFSVDSNTMQHTCCSDSEGNFFIIWPNSRFSAGVGSLDSASGWYTDLLTCCGFFRMPPTCNEFDRCSPNPPSIFLGSLPFSIFIRLLRQFSMTAASRYSVVVLAKFLQIIMQKLSRSCSSWGMEQASPKVLVLFSTSFREISLSLNLATRISDSKAGILLTFSSSLRLLPAGGSLGGMVGAMIVFGTVTFTLGSYSSSFAFQDRGLLMAAGRGGGRG